MQPDLDGLLAAIGSFGMPGAPAAAGSAESLTVAPSTWDELTHHLRRRRLSGLAVAATTAGVLDLTEDQHTTLAEIDRNAQGWAARTERLTIELTADLATAGIPTVVLKGPVTARRAYADLAWRPFFDVDLLVRTDDLDATVEWLEQSGSQRLVPELRRGFDRRFGKSVTLRSPDGVEIDVHRTLVVGPLCQLLDIDDLWAGTETVELVPGCSVGALHPDVAFLHACLHVVAGGAVGILPVRDLLGLAPDADLERSAALARHWQATAAMQAAVAHAGSHALPVARELAAWAQALDPSAAEERVLRAYQADGGAQRLAAASWRYVRGHRGKVAYAAALALPSAENRRARQRSWRGHAGRVLGLGKRRRT